MEEGDYDHRFVVYRQLRRDELFQLMRSIFQVEQTVVMLGGGDGANRIVPTIHVKESLKEFEEPFMWHGKASQFQEHDFKILK